MEGHNGDPYGGRNSELISTEGKEESLQCQWNTGKYGRKKAGQTAVRRKGQKKTMRRGQLTLFPDRGEGKKLSEKGG